MPTKRPKRWPARNSDALADYTARQLPEVSRRQAMSTINTAMQAVRKSLCEQVADGVEYPSVKLRHVGVFELRRYAPTRRPRLDGKIQEIPPRWRMVFRPCALWQDEISALDATRQTPEGDPGQHPSEETAWPHPPAGDEEEGRTDVPDV